MQAFSLRLRLPLPPIGNGLCTVAMRRSSLFRAAAECLQGFVPPIRGARGSCRLPAGLDVIAAKEARGSHRSGRMAVCGAAGAPCPLRKSRVPGVSLSPKARGSVRLPARCRCEVNSPCGALGTKRQSGHARRQSRCSKRATDVRVCNVRVHHCNLAQGGRRGSFPGERRYRSWHLVEYAVG
jgi:hypothetical protein